ncbi:zinc transporter ZTP29-like [Phragmites australis]|uniref:zinc transporter ZTP29-like n=1 Tax=Phragmites australis TaxID=29695 RepID=UPI002D798587|nr:zinc transporter ZTP29-like [Phragmites australis]XP_062205587.1 zinc transporter ZTP29-like [Phragmites australis]XP_062205588.1 zinc transporter ZTP29-like [Phragmites australis]
MDPKVAVALTLSLVGGLSTSLGALLAILNRAPSNKTLGVLQGFATGLMLSMSFFDLAYDAVNAIGFLKGNLWFFAGALLFSTIADIFPEPDCSLEDQNDKQTGKSIAGKELMMRHRRRVIFSVVVTAIVAGVSLQNFPVGTAAFIGTTKGFRVGLNLALAIALHYIPEGISVALPAYFATCSKWQAFKLATLSGFAEPLGVIIVAYVFPSNLNPEILEGLLGLVGGVMAFLTLYEMLPLAFEYAGRKDAVKAVFVGMAFMSMSLYFLDISLPKDMNA